MKNASYALVISIASLVLSCADGSKASFKSSGNFISQVTDTDQWKLVWSDEFVIDSINTKNWNYQVLPAGQFNGEWQSYTSSSSNAYIENECLVIEAVHESETHGFNQYTSARLNTANKQSWQYGKIEARIKLPKGKGIWPAFWMLGANINENGGDTPWPFCGEIDILELYGTKNDAVVEANLHYADQNDSHTMMGAVPYKLKEGIFADNFHVFGLEWDKNNISWFVDGKKYTSTSITSEERSEFHNEFFILLNLAVGGNYAGRPDETTSFPQKMLVDWVRVYQKNIDN
ncbi:glycoside hydrolase family 16 protein [Winogradskyella alexanderae]|uniref:Glycoside hydrolase family 16 protein n=1 Tax=Winogradskyella alexanderae TaxID=2877123 RepID=A0ABS7XVI3_9FLAO|nr:glycoside hydrolase family 16 protein [Winogradskyella alexanderae]MCA0133499.1 glycoside hydrolase family 16 protein [Winogradskyella alexanderae]